MILRICLFIAVALTLYILWTRKSAQDRTSEGATNQLNTRVLFIGLGFMGCVVTFVMAAELITRL